MRSIVSLALNDVRLTVRDRASFFFLLVLPLVMTWFFGSMGGSAGDKPRFTLTVVDGDVSWLSRALVGELDSGQADLKEVSPAEWDAPGDHVRTLVIPAGFAAQVLSGEQQVLRLVKDADANEAYSLAAQVHVVRAIIRTLGRLLEMQALDAGGSPLGEEAAVSEFRALGERPDLVTLDVSTAGRGHPTPRGMAQSVPGIMTMTVLMMTLIYGAVFLANEKRQGMLRRQATLPVGRTELFLGKLGGRVLIAALQVAVLLVAGRWVFGVSLTGSPVGLLVLLASYVFAVAALSTLLGAVVRSAEQASSIGWIASMVLAGLGGCWWPGEFMPAWLRAAGHAFPTAWAMDGLHALISFGQGLDAVVLPAAVLVAFGGLFSVLGGRYLRYE